MMPASGGKPQTASSSSTLPNRALNRAGEWFNESRLPGEWVLLGTALLVGLGTGLGAVIFRYLIQAVSWIGYEWIPSVTADWGRAYIVVVPAIGGLLVGLLVYYFAREAKGHGVPEVMLAVATHGGRIRPVVALIKALASSLTIGSGGSAGREGPIVQIGSALGSTLGQALHLSDDRIRNLVACGAAGGIAATFNAPIAGVFFALEIILGEFNARFFASVVVSAVAASVIGQAIFGDNAAFPVPEYSINSVWEFGFYVILGLLAAIVGVVFVRLLYGMEDFFDDRERIPEWLKPGIGGLLLGLTALAYPVVTQFTWKGNTPHIFSVGYDVIESSLTNQLALTLVLGLLVLKLIATTLTLGSGGSGGVFAPSLFMGAMLGAAFGMVLDSLFPGIVGSPGAYALVGMAAVFSAGAHAPITAVIILFELTGDYRIILPLMLTVVVATLPSMWLLKGESIYTIKLTRRGIHIRRGRDVDIMQGLSVADAMNRKPYVVDQNMPLSDLIQFFQETHGHSFPVVDDAHRLVGMVSLSDYERATDTRNVDGLRVIDIATMGDTLVAYSDEPLSQALRQIGGRDINKLPVVTREKPTQVIGVIRRRDIVRAYDTALARQAKTHASQSRAGLRQADNTEFVDIEIPTDSLSTNRSLASLSEQLPHECVVVSIRRHGSVLIPHGDTVLQPGDLVSVFLRRSDEDQLRECLLGKSLE